MRLRLLLYDEGLSKMAWLLGFERTRKWWLSNGNLLAAELVIVAISWLTVSITSLASVWLMIIIMNTLWLCFNSEKPYNNCWLGSDWIVMFSSSCSYRYAGEDEMVKLLLTLHFRFFQFSSDGCHFRPDSFLNWRARRVKKKGDSINFRKQIFYCQKPEII